MKAIVHTRFSSFGQGMRCLVVREEHLPSMSLCSTRNLDMARSIGADHVIDYTKEDFTRNRERYDLILAVNGYHPLSAYERALNPQGIYVCVGGSMSQFFQAMLLGPLMSRKGGKRLGSMGEALDGGAPRKRGATSGGPARGQYWESVASPIVNRLKERRL